MKYAKQFLLLLFIAFSFSCGTTTFSGPYTSRQPSKIKPQQTSGAHAWQKHELPKNAHPALQNVIDYGIEQTKLTNTYDPAYVTISYPNGDLPIEKGVCTDVVIRAFRKGDVDLQKEVHEDMKANFSAYPKKWGLKKADTNIDHRRVPNLQTYFTRKGKSLPVTETAADYKPGDIVTWDLAEDGIPHIGLVTNLWSEETKRYVIVHNIGSGARLEDRLFDWKPTGHYRYF